MLWLLWDGSRGGARARAEAVAVAGTGCDGARVRQTAAVHYDGARATTPAWQTTAILTHSNLCVRETGSALSFPFSEELAFGSHSAGG